MFNIQEFQKLKGHDEPKSLNSLAIIPSFLTNEECDFLMQYYETQKSERLSFRNRLMFDNADLADYLWERIEDKIKINETLDHHGDLWKSCGLNPRFRLVKYDENDSFSTHEDGFYEKSYRERSFATLMIYLNTLEKCDGGITHGQTNFIEHGFQIIPQKGLCVVFLVDGLLHNGEKVLKGYKYILSTDIMYSLSTAKDRSIKEELFELKKEAISCEEWSEKSHSIWTKYFDLERKYSSIK